MNNIKIDKVNELLSQEISKILQEEFAEDFGVISVNLVLTSKDLKNAKIWISFLDELKIQDAIYALNKKSESIRREIGAKIKIRNMPKLLFVIDEKADTINHINKIIDKIEQENKK